jgi:hypothetical protein
MLTGRNGIQHFSIAAATHAAGQHASPTIVSSSCIPCIRAGILRANGFRHGVADVKKVSVAR